MKGIKILLLFIFLILFLSCEDKDQSNDDAKISYRYYNLENAGWKSLKHAQKADDIIFTATEVPLPYYILKDRGNQDLVEADSIYQANKRERIVEFEFLQDEEKDLLDEQFTNMEYTESVKYMSFEIEKDFYVVTSKKDTIACSGVTFERNFKVSPQQRILLFFTNIDPDDKIQLVYQDRLFNKGTLKFKFKENITKLIL